MTGSGSPHISLIDFQQMGLFEKNRVRSFFSYVQQYEVNDPSTHKHGYNLNTMTMAALFKEYGVNEETIEFIGHSIALHRYILFTLGLGHRYVLFSLPPHIHMQSSLFISSLPLP